MTLTLEQELENLIANQDYTVSVHGGDNGYVNVRLFYVPALVIRGEGALSYVANGLIAEQHWFKSKRKWQKISRWVEQEIAGHQALLKIVRQS